MFSKASNLGLKHALRRLGTSQGETSEPTSPASLRTDVINLYKNLLYLSRDWHTDLRPQIKKAFLKNREVKDPDEIRELIGKGEYICRELIATYNLRKYRAMKRRYYGDDNKVDQLSKEFDF